MLRKREMGAKLKDNVLTQGQIMLKKTIFSIISLLIAGQTMASEVELDCKSTTCKLRYSGYKDKSVEVPEGISSIKIRYSGSGDLSVEGDVEEIDVTSKGSGDLDLRDLKADSIELDYSGSGSLYLHAKQVVSGYNDGSGKVVIAGGAKVSLDGNGSGRVVQR